MFQSSAAGLSDREIAAQVDLPLFTVRGLLMSPLHTGFLRDGGPGSCAPLIGDATCRRPPPLALNSERWRSEGVAWMPT